MTGEIFVPGKGSVQLQQQHSPRIAKPGVIVPGGKFQIKRAEHVNGVPQTIDENIKTLQEIAAARGEEPKRYEIGNQVIRFKRKGIEVEIVPDPSQLVAVNAIINQQFGCITGAAGTGKTTVERILLSLIEQGMHDIDIARYGKRGADAANEGPVTEQRTAAIAFAAFTGKAMQQMKGNLPEEYQRNCFTIHWLLGFYPEYYTVDEPDPERPGQYILKNKMKFVPYYNATNKLPWKVIILDEASMIPIELWNQLIDACHRDIRIILIGDINQLPPVMGRSVFGYALQKWPSYELTQIHRQKGEDNPIVDNAWKILQGKIPADVPGKFDMYKTDKGSAPALDMLLKVAIVAQRKGVFNPDTDMIIVPQNVGEIGQERINERLIPYFNPVSADPLDMKGRRITIAAGFEHKTFAIGDKVMATVNDYENGVTNGMLGKVTDIMGNTAYRGKHYDPALSGKDVHEDDIDSLMDFTKLQQETAIETPLSSDSGDARKRAASHIVTVDFGLDQMGNPIVVPFASTGQVQSLMLAYAATCHKCQGSEFKTVIILVSAVNSLMLTREWLYTAVTRGAERVLLVYDNRGLLTALQRQRIKGSNLQEKAQAFIDWQEEITKSARSEEELFSLLPTLWQPKEIAR